MNLHAFFIIILALYLASTLCYILRLIIDKPVLSVLGLRGVVLAAFLQTLTLGFHFLRAEEVFSTFLDYYQLSALILSYTFIILCFKKRFYASGLFFLIPIDLLIILSLTHQNPYALKIPWPLYGYLWTHLISIFLSLAVFIVGMVSAVLFLISERNIKAKKLGGWVSRLPSLAVLDDIHYKAVTLGFVIFSLAIVTGAGYSKVLTGHYISDDLKQGLSIILWIFFAVILNFRVRKGWQGHKGILLSLIGLIALVLLFFIGLK